MGRTLHYQVLNQDQLSDAHLETLLAVSEAYNTGKFAKVWTCENFFLDPCLTYPNWQAGHDWKSFEKRYGELEAEGSSPLSIRRQLVAEGVAKRHSEELRGFTKVGGNEWNALLVYTALLKITELTPALIKLSDEGEFLLASIVLQRGKAKLDVKDMETAWRYWEKQGFLPEDRYGCRTKLEAQQALFGKYGAKLQAPETFCRPVKPEDFQEHPEYNAGEIMAGFHGEYYGLSDQNPFDESMHAIARIHSLLPEGMTLRFGKKLL
jgi:hypothetical protein